MMFTFNRAYGQLLPLSEAAYKKAGLSEKYVEFLSTKLRASSAMDVMSEFLKGIDRSSDRVLNDGYIDALEDFMKFAKEQM
jgi:hypothetical protein